MNKNALNKIGYGMYVIGSRKGDLLNAQIANTVFQVAAEPPTIAVSINKKNLTHDFIAESRVFAVAILNENTPLNFIGRFGFRSGRELNKMEGVKYRIGQTGAPIILENAAAYLEVRVTKEVDVGTHTLFIGELVDADIIVEQACMTYEYYHKIKRGTTPKTAPSFVNPKEEK